LKSPAELEDLVLLNLTRRRFRNFGWIRQAARKFAVSIGFFKIDGFFDG
jgi:hypothetical protein